MVLMVERHNRMSGSQKTLKGKSENNFRQPRGLPNRQSDSPSKKESTYSLSRGGEEVRLLQIIMIR
jgi:hypothetical protein